MTIINAATPFGFVPSAAGDSAAVYIRRLRERINDIPRLRTEQLTVATGQLVFQVEPKVNDDTFLKVLQPGSIVIGFDVANPPSSGVAIDLDSGMMVFQAQPPVGANTVTVQKRKVQWRDSQLQEALEAGVRALWPALHAPCVDETIQLTTNQWDYALPSVFADPGVKIHEIYVREIPAGTQQFRPLPRWERHGGTTLHLSGSQSYTPGTALRIEYDGPYRSLEELEGRSKNLPILYAAAQLMGFDEPKRLRNDGAGPAAAEQASPYLGKIQAASYFWARFQDELKACARPMGMGRAQATWRR